MKKVAPKKTAMKAVMKKPAPKKPAKKASGKKPAFMVKPGKGAAVDTDMDGM